MGYGIGGRINQIIDDLVKATSGKLARKWKGQSRDDISQELYLWCIAKGIDGSFVDTESDEEYQEEIRKLRNSLWWAGETYCQREHRQAKAFRAGYSPEDEYFYSVKQLEHMLEVYYSVGVEERPPVTYEVSGRGSVDPAEGGNHLAGMVDLTKGLAAMDDGYRARLEVRYGPLSGYSDDAVAGLAQSEAYRLTGWHPEALRGLLGDTGDAVRHRVGTALRNLQTALGGPSPWTREVA